jgi:hypothetical protein
MKIEWAYSTDIIKVNQRTYQLSFPLRCAWEKEEDYVFITSELLDIIGTGLNEEEAELNFFQEFDFIYQRYNQLNDNHLSKRILNIKNILNYLVKSIS